ncbi:hypothetical protein F8O01_08415 [Pseudoclavibacter chungangensis]|uniref:Uncharacterized protein n=1 Tax=Pseudoclavibacter chungangensis TaxID=587635 RepID=A0A7J5BSG7_9MICO|nr:hypothetical protein [Pseudoclavibacter chungangensis]KAB1657260.1 hypothetical protein F8O01_08415 [Pseudoclavibacter chungangensis]NYJ66296.1 hypothetical protein [Pseudoclavibacter chungangensis]
MQATRSETRRRVHVQGAQFFLALGDADVAPSRADPDPWRHGQLVAASHAAGLVAVATGVGDGQVGVRLRLRPEPPPLTPLGELDEAEEVSVRTDGGVLLLGSGATMRRIEHPVETRDGWVRIRCVARGRRVRRQTEGDSAERYLIDLWPELDMPRLTHRVRLRNRRAGS